MKIPSCEKKPFEIVQHGHKRVDNYHWLRDENWQEFIKGNLDFKDQAVYDYIKAENQYTEDNFNKKTESLQKEIYEELISRINEDDESAPQKHGDYLYYTRIEKGQNYKSHYRRKIDDDSSEELVIDENKEAEGLGFYRLGYLSLAKGDELAAYAENTTGSMIYDIQLFDLNKKEKYPFKITNTNGSFAWSKDYSMLYFVERHPENGRGYKVFSIEVTKGLESKKEVFEKPEELKDLFMSISSTANSDYLLIECSDGERNEIFIKKNDGSDESFQSFRKIEQGLKYDVDYIDGYFYILNNEEATNFKISRAKEEAKDQWEDFVAERPGHYIEYFSIKNGHLITEVKNNEKALSQVEIQNLSTNKMSELSFDDEAYLVQYMGSREYDCETFQYAYESPIKPRTTYEYTLATGETKVIKEGKAPNYDSSKYVVKREFAKGHDGAMIPLTIIHKKDFVKNGEAPAFVYAYGSYGMGMPAYFSASFASLLDRGFSYTIAHIRGGDDKGYSWYLDGKLKNKLNTFKDYISSCEYLIENKYTAEKKIVANGGSAGGLLMGAVTNMAPELFKGVVLDVPFVDVINTISDETLPLTAPEWNEWGNPILDKDSYEYMMQYSPYDNVEAKDYPHMLFNSGITDEQVTYWEPLKMVAKLRELKTDNHSLFLKIKMEAGHAGSSSRYKSYEELAFKFAFTIWCLSN